jgi:hypothetical protein
LTETETGGHRAGNGLPFEHSRIREIEIEIEVPNQKGQNRPFERIVNQILLCIVGYSGSQIRTHEQSEKMDRIAK